MTNENKPHSPEAPQPPTPPPPPPPPPPADSLPGAGLHTGFEGDFDVPLTDQLPAIRIDGDAVVLKNGAELGTDYCIKSGRPADFVIEKALRDPRNPLTWFGGRYRIPVGLSKKHRESRLVALALTWSILAIGILILGSNLIQLNYSTLGVGCILILFSGIFRAAHPVWSPKVYEDHIEIRGTGAGFRHRLLQEGIAEEVLPPVGTEEAM